MAEEIRITIETSETVPVARDSVTDVEETTDEKGCETAGALADLLENKRMERNEATKKSMRDTSFETLMTQGWKARVDKAMGR